MVFRGYGDPSSGSRSLILWQNIGGHNHILVTQMEYLVLTYMFLTQVPSKLPMLKHLFLKFYQGNSGILNLGQTKLDQNNEDPPKNRLIVIEKQKYNVNG